MEINIDELSYKEKREAIANWLLDDFFQLKFQKLCEAYSDNPQIKDLKKYKWELQLMLECIVDELDLDAAKYDDEWKDVYQEYFEE